eukprot:TRINITY_DN88634_c0_g1_i1.p1 TRINITY_DN88634_c0_g1~~TRINITY_DN88634_c0_g1_i1.p1  ORF type:complete len:347 (-),score=46.19 TRINITY_DN88634_c0_g1_i1:78-1094(-)
MRVFLLLLACSAVFCLDDRPIIGLLTQPISNELGHEAVGGGVGLDASVPVPERRPYPGKYYVPASYVKFLEAGGARVVPIHFDISDSELNRLFKKLNGVLFPGGGQSLAPGSKYRDLTTRIYNLSLASASTSKPVPLWGTCLGFETIAVEASNNQHILTRFNSENLTQALYVNAKCLGQNDGNCRMISSTTTPPNVLSYLRDNSINVTFNNHQYGVSVDNFDKYLANDYTLLATSYDRDGKQFVAAMEAKNAPIYAVQFHPEKALFEWNTREVIQHTEKAIIANGYLNRFLIDQSRKNDHHFSSIHELVDQIIYNYPVTYTAKEYASMWDFEQCYFFN